MLNYSDYMGVSFNLGSGSSSTDFIRSQFDYGTRQRRGIRGYDAFGVTLVLNEDNGEMSDWMNFWYALNYGNDKFYTGIVINGDQTTTKIARFTSGYEVSQIGANKFIVSVPLELISSPMTIIDIGVTATFIVNDTTIINTQSATITDTGNTAIFSVNDPTVTVI